MKNTNKTKKKELHKIYNLFVTMIYAEILLNFMYVCVCVDVDEDDDFHTEETYAKHFTR